MIKIAVQGYDGNESVILAYNVSVTKTINSFPTLTFSFDAVGQNKVAESLLGPRALFTLADGQQYRLTVSNPVPNFNYRTYTITATHISHDLHDNYVRNTLAGVQSINSCMDLAIQGTALSYQIDGNFNPHDFGENTIGAGHGDDILSAVAQAWACEYWFDNRTIHIAKTIGTKDSFLFVDRVNANYISWTEDYSSFATAIHGFGKQLEQSSDQDSSNQNIQYSCEADYYSPLAGKSGIGAIWQDAYTSDTITDSNALQAALKGSLHDYPDVQYSMSWVTFANNSQIKNNIEIGNTGWLRDRYGLDVNVKIQSYTHYLDKRSGNSDTITFGNKIFDASEYESRQRKAQDQAKMIANLQWKINTAKSVGNAWTESEVQEFDNSKRG